MMKANSRILKRRINVLCVVLITSNILFVSVNIPTFFSLCPCVCLYVSLVMLLVVKLLLVAV